MTLFERLRPTVALALLMLGFIAFAAIYVIASETASSTGAVAALATVAGSSTTGIVAMARDIIASEVKVDETEKEE